MTSYWLGIERNGEEPLARVPRGTNLHCSVEDQVSKAREISVVLTLVPFVG